MILLTGANGFIGKSLSRTLSNTVTVDINNCDYNGDLCDKEFVNSLPNVDTVIHLAAFNSTRKYYNTNYESTGEISRCSLCIC